MHLPFIHTVEYGYNHGFQFIELTFDFFTGGIIVEAVKEGWIMKERSKLSEGKTSL